MEKKKSGKRGGRRPGAGRPSLGITKKVSLTLTDEEWEAIESSGEKNIGHWVKKKLREEEPKQTTVVKVKGNSTISLSLYLGLDQSIENLGNRIQLGLGHSTKEIEDLREAISFYDKNYGVSSKGLWEKFREIEQMIEKSNQKQKQEEEKQEEPQQIEDREEKKAPSDLPDRKDKPNTLYPIQIKIFLNKVKADNKEEEKYIKSEAVKQQFFEAILTNNTIQDDKYICPITQKTFEKEQDMMLSALTEIIKSKQEKTT